MKVSVFIIVTLSIVVQSCSTNKAESEESIGFTIQGELTTPSDKIYLSKIIDGEMEHLDSAVNVQSNFSFNGSVDAPEMYYLKFNEDFTFPLFLENSLVEIEVNGNSTDSVVVSGSKIHDEWDIIRTRIDSFDVELDSIADNYYAADDSGDDSLKHFYELQYDNLDLERTGYISSMVSSNADSYITPYLVYRFLSYSSSLNDLERYLENFDNSIQNSVYSTYIHERIETLRKTEVGVRIPEFSLPDTNGTTVSINEFQGKYVLIDFWASWCGPCRKENPNVVRAFQKYKDRGFTVLGVSLDDSKEQWLNAIEDDNLTWTHISDLQGWKNTVAVDFGVRSIPYSILIDPSGIILDKNLRDKELHEKLDEIFTNESTNSSKL